MYIDKSLSSGAANCDQVVQGPGFEPHDIAIITVSEGSPLYREFSPL